MSRHVILVILAGKEGDSVKVLKCLGYISANDPSNADRW